MMKIVFHDNFRQTYTSDPAASPGRLDHALDLLQEKYPLVTPSPCSEDDVLLAHTPGHLEHVRMDTAVYNMALLAAGAAIKSSDLALAGHASFALCRPPGHHASPSSCWGFCYFNNVAIAVKKLLEENVIERALIIDFDLHFGDGTSNIFTGEPAVSFWHVKGSDSSSFVSNLESYLEKADADIVAVSAGFDRHVNDWGGMLHTKDYGVMGRLLGAFARDKCRGRLFAVLEGGYNARSLGDSVQAFCDGVSTELQ